MTAYQLELLLSLMDAKIAEAAAKAAGRAGFQERTHVDKLTQDLRNSVKGER